VKTPAVNSAAAKVMEAKQIIVSKLDDFPTSCAWSADGQWLAVGTGSGRLHLLNVADACISASWQAHTSPVQSLAWHPREPVLVSADQQAQLKFWRADMSDAAGLPLLQQSLRTREAWVQQIAWRPDGDYLAVAAGKQVEVFSRQGEAVSQIAFEPSSVAGIAWHPRGTELAIAGYQGIKVVTGAVHKIPRATWLRWQGSLLNCVYSPDGKVIAAACQDNAVHFWRMKDSTDSQMSGYASKPLSLAWTKDSKRLLTSGSSEVVGWHFARGGPEGTAPLLLDFHRDVVTHVAVQASTGWLASGCKGGQVALWSSADAIAPAYGFAMDAPLAAVLWAQRGQQVLLAAVDESGHVGVWAITSIG
jgi:WD40 repeat protein